MNFLQLATLKKVLFRGTYFINLCTFCNIFEAQSPGHKPVQRNQKNIYECIFKLFFASISKSGYSFFAKTGLTRCTFVKIWNGKALFSPAAQLKPSFQSFFSTTSCCGIPIFRLRKKHRHWQILIPVLFADHTSMTLGYVRVVSGRLYNRKTFFSSKMLWTFRYRFSRDPKISAG